MTPAPRDEMGWPIVMSDGERCCASGADCRRLRATPIDDEREWLPSTEFRIDGYCSCECRDFDELRQEHAAALLAEAQAARAKAIEDSAKALDEEASKLDMERKCGDWRLKDERRIRTDQALYDARLVRARAAQDRAKETT